MVAASVRNIILALIASLLPPSKGGSKKNLGRGNIVSHCQNTAWTKDITFTTPLFAQRSANNIARRKSNSTSSPRRWRISANATILPAKSVAAETVKKAKHPARSINFWLK
jgi:hypothetical protein